LSARNSVRLPVPHGSSLPLRPRASHVQSYPGLDARPEGSPPLRMPRAGLHSLRTLRLCDLLMGMICQMRRVLTPSNHPSELQSDFSCIRGPSPVPPTCSPVPSPGRSTCYSFRPCDQLLHDTPVLIRSRWYGITTLRFPTEMGTTPATVHRHAAGESLLPHSSSLTPLLSDPSPGTHIDSSPCWLRFWPQHSICLSAKTSLPPPTDCAYVPIGVTVVLSTRLPPVVVAVGDVVAVPCHCRCRCCLPVLPLPVHGLALPDANAQWVAAVRSGQCRLPPQPLPRTVTPIVSFSTSGKHAID
jgi:hypothetical protein